MRQKTTCNLEQTTICNVELLAARAACDAKIKQPLRIRCACVCVCVCVSLTRSSSVFTVLLHFFPLPQKTHSQSHSIYRSAGHAVLVIILVQVFKIILVQVFKYPRLVFKIILVQVCKTTHTEPGPWPEQSRQPWQNNLMAHLKVQNQLFLLSKDLQMLTQDLGVLLSATHTASELSRLP